MKKELILKQWQKDIVEDESKIIMANISRGGSKTFILANKVLYEKPNIVLYISNSKELKLFEEQFNEIFKLDDDIRESVEYFECNPTHILIRFKTKATIMIYKEDTIPKDVEIDMVLFDDCLPQLDIKADNYVSIFTIKYPIMNLFNCRKYISYYVIGIKKLEESGYLTKEQIKDTKQDIGELDFDKYFDLCDEYKKMFEEKPVRGLRRKANLYEESAGNFKPNNIYLNQKERDVIKIQMEQVLYSFENQVDSCLRKSELQLAKVNHNVVDTTRSILNKFEIADCEEPKTFNYYLTMDLNRDGENKAILFYQYDNELKIEKFISFDDKKLGDIAHKLIDEIKPYKNGKIIIPNVVWGQNLIDYIKAEGFENILELDGKDFNKCNIYNLELFNNKNLIYNLSENNRKDFDYYAEFSQLKKQLDNLVIRSNSEGSHIMLDRKDNSIDKYWIVIVFFTFYKLGFKIK